MHKVGRNDSCPCGSGKKYKKCCELKAQHKKINAQILSPSTQETQETAKVSSLFFEPPNPVM
jgi:hypothetical protein